MKLAIEEALKAWDSWPRMPWWDKVSVLMQAADLLSDLWPNTLVGDTMLGQSKTVSQAEIEAAGWRFNIFHLPRLMG